ncbi:helix-turn-helix domain-containing protein [uncultured Brevibacillus sp.]|uniref:helix-turn-helix domain-containing protein n=1 Tax=uncultured Brevibacillus sp. TaxID=169970 RepID=UPI0025921DA9|nr:helix-turn-helix transcriptional regulator [uncultured Brevibacillus sp.]
MENSFGKYLELLRGKISLREASEKTGLSHTYIRNLELGKKTDPSHETLIKLANAYGVKYGELLSKKFESIDYPTILEKYGPSNKGYSVDNDLISFLSREDITCKGHTLTEDDRNRILGMLAVLFPHWE